MMKCTLNNTYIVITSLSRTQNRERRPQNARVDIWFGRGSYKGWERGDYNIGFKNFSYQRFFTTSWFFEQYSLYPYISFYLSTRIVHPLNAVTFTLKFRIILGFYQKLHLVKEEVMFRFLQSANVTYESVQESCEDTVKNFFFESIVETPWEL